MTYVIELQSAEREREQEQAAARAGGVTAAEASLKSGPSEGPSEVSEPDSMCDVDMEKGALPTEVRSLR